MRTSKLKDKELFYVTKLFSLLQLDFICIDQKINHISYAEMTCQLEVDLNAKCAKKRVQTDLTTEEYSACQESSLQLILLLKNAKCARKWNKINFTTKGVKTREEYRI
jgi:hypothetical protein